MVESARLEFLVLCFWHGAFWFDTGAVRVSPCAACCYTNFFILLIPALTGRFFPGDEAHEPRQRPGYTGEAVGNRHTDQVEATRERSVSDARYAVGDRDADQLTTRERTSADAGDAAGNRHVGQVAAVAKRRILYCDDAAGNRYANKARTAIECIGQNVCVSSSG